MRSALGGVRMAGEMSVRQMGVEVHGRNFSGRKNILDKDLGNREVALCLVCTSGFAWLGGECLLGHTAEGFLYLAYPMGIGIRKCLNSPYDWLS